MTDQSSAARDFHIAVLPGDGIGPEVTDCGKRILDAIAATPDGPSFTFEQLPAGYGTYLEIGDSLPDTTVERAKEADAILLGAMDVAQIPVTATQPLRGMRRALSVGASVRPAKSFDGVPIPASPIDAVVVREVTEGLFSGVEYRVGPDSACAVRLITRQGSQKAARIAFDQASARRGKVTAVHKLGALQVSDGLFLESVAEVAAQYPDIEYETRNVDACALEMVVEPHEFDVVLCTNSFGDILSDVAAGLAGGLGVAPSACLGPDLAYFEPVHGTAPDIAGKGVANPTATILTTAMMLRYLGETTWADAVDAAVANVLTDDTLRTGDLGGAASSDEATSGVIRNLVP